MEDHSGHRRRQREKFTRTFNLDGFGEEEVLELLLFYSVPRADTLPIARRLLGRFGSLRAVLDAPFDELKAVEGVGEASATLLKLVPSFARAYYTGDAPGEILLTTEDFAAKLLPEFFGRREELFAVLLLDDSGRLLEKRVFASGGRREVAVDTAEVASLAEKFGADAVVAAHNHPGGLAVPSAEDTKTTLELIEALRPSGARLLDHLIFAGRERFSYAESRRFGAVFR